MPNTIFSVRAMIRRAARRAFRRSPALAPLVLCVLFCLFSLPARAQNAAPDAPQADAPATERGRRELRRRIFALNRANALARLLDLTPEQRRRFGEIRRRYADERRGVAEQLRRAEQELDDRLYADALDEREIDLAVRRVAELHAGLTRLRARLELELREVLTAEQLRRLRSVREEARLRRRPPLDASRRQRSS